MSLPWKLSPQNFYPGVEVMDYRYDLPLMVTYTILEGRKYVDVSICGYVDVSICGCVCVYMCDCACTWVCKFQPWSLERLPQ